MIRSVEIDLLTRSPLNGSQGVTQGARRAFKAFKDKQRTEVKAALQAAWTAPPPAFFHDPSSGFTLPNRWEVRLTRITIGVMDPGALGGAFKAIQDELATWCGQPDERRLPWTAWSYEQRKPTREEFGEHARFVHRVVIEVRDLEPKPDRIVKMRAVEHIKRGEESAAKARQNKRIREEKARREAATKARDGGITRAGSVLSYQPAAAASGASTAARGRAEAAFAKLVGGPAGPAIAAAQEYPGAVHVSVEAGKVRRSSTAAFTIDPGEEAPARDMAACETCGARVAAPCVRRGSERMVFGVHVTRARAAGLHVPADDRAAVRPARSNGHAVLADTLRAANAARPVVGRRLATVPGQARLVARQAYLVLPWWNVCGGCRGDGDRVACEACGGTGRRRPEVIHRELRLEGLDIARETVDYTVPIEHRARWGDRHGLIRLHRGEATLPRLGVCWVYRERA